MHIRRAVLPVSSDADVTPSSNLRLLPLLSLSVVVFILLFFAVRYLKRSLHLPTFTWLRGKGRGSKGRIGLSGIELLPTSLKNSIPPSTPSPFSAAFNMEGNSGKTENPTLSRSSSLEALSKFAMGSPPHLTSRRGSHSLPPLSLPSFLRNQHKPLHRRSRSLNVPHRSASSTMPTSAPPSPSSKTLLIDFSTSNSSSTSASSDLGTHKLRSSPPLIPGLPIPSQSPMKARTLPRAKTQAWAFDLEEESGVAEDSLLAAFKRSQTPVEQQESMPLIQYERSLTPVPSMPALVPKRLGTANPFASLEDSFVSHAISDEPVSPSPLAPLPLSPPGIELVPVQATAGLPVTKLVDLSEDETENDRAVSFNLPVELKTPERLEFIECDAPAHGSAEYTHPVDQHEAEETAEHSEVVSDPFDDSHAVNLSQDAFDSSFTAPHSPLETRTLHVDLSSSLILPHGDASAPSSPPLTSSPRLPRQETDETLKLEPGATTPSWNWDGSWSPLSAPAPIPPLESNQELSTLPVYDAEPQTVHDAGTGYELLSFDNPEREQAPSHEVECTSGPAVDMQIDVDKEIDPADTWFIEEPTAVWDQSWVGEDAKGGPSFDVEGGSEDVEHVDLGSRKEINVLEELADEMVAGPSEPISIHVFEDLLTAAPFHEDAVITGNELDDFTLHSNIATPLVVAATPLLSTPTTPNTPLPELPSPTPVVSSPVLEEHPDPDLLPLPEVPLPTTEPTIISPVPVKAQSPPVHHAQTPTPPASPPPLSNAPQRPLWSLRAADAPPLGLPAAAIPAADPAPQVVVSEVQIVVEAEDSAEEIVESVASSGAEVPQHELLVGTDAAGEHLHEEEKPLTRPSTPQPELLASLPGTFPSSPSPTPATLLPDTPSLPASASTTEITSQKISPAPSQPVLRNRNRIRTPRSAIDIALAMQLRPGLGAGADPAWMVRFLMATLGWFAILVSGELP
ncbi:hypothetical protein H0H92_000900 [Tricholoma furcatifolium]|nr:hypothetical protein H0H92_000900 [Tricholoma furcatifolium]